MAVLDRMRAVDLGAWEKEMIVVDNCSTDGTRELLQQVNWPEARVIFQPRNMGKAGSVRTGFAQATGDYGVVQDADFEYDPEELALVRQGGGRDRRRGGVWFAHAGRSRDLQISSKTIWVCAA